MKIKHKDLEIPSDNPFKNCKLGRYKYAEALTSIVNSYADGFVLAINNEWGTGKTTFVKMWQKHLDTCGYKTLYFNAWENDFDSHPLVAIMSELKTISKQNDATFKSLVKKGAILTKNLLPVLAQAIAEKYIDTKIITEAIGNITKSASEILKDEIDEYANKKQGLIEFRVGLEDFIKKNNNGKPIVFIIDELDRCRPNYAVEVLEQVKHFFNVPGIVFILSIDKIQLGNAVRGVYNSEQLNANEYLRRFIDIEYVIPAPAKGDFSKYLFDYFGFDSFFRSDERQQYHELREDGSSFLNFSSLLFEKTNTTLRQQEKIFAQARVILNSFSLNNYLFPSLYLFLIYLKDFHPVFYAKLRARKNTTQEIVFELKDIYPKNIEEKDLRSFGSVEALLALFYNNYYAEINYNSKVTERDKDTGEDKLLIESSLDSNDLLFLINHYRKAQGSSTKLDFLLNKIDLMDNLTF